MKYLPVLFLFFLLAACSSPQKAIMQTWKITDIKIVDSLNTLAQSQKDIVTAKLKSDIQFTFLADSIYQVRSGNEVTNGKWWFSTDKKMLYTTVKDKTVESKIYQLKNKGFSFESAGESNQSFQFTCMPVVTDKK